MKKSLVLLLILFIKINYSFGQNTNYNAHLSNIIPPTPEAFKFTKYGNVPVNESSGIASVSIPLGEYVVGRIKVPLSLNYNADGVKVDEMNNFTGMSWNLAAGGMITRVVNDLPDYYQTGSSNNRIFYSPEQLTSFTLQAPYDSEELWNISRPWFDSEADLFSFNFNGYSGSFVFDDNFEPHLLNYNSELKIGVENLGVNNMSIHIITPDGIKYYFGGASSEKTMIQNGILQSWSEQAQSAFYLYKILDINGDEVIFEYDSKTSFRKTIGITQSFTKLVSQREPCEGNNMEYEFLTNKDAGVILLDISGQKTLKRIYSNRINEQVTFTSIYNNNTEVQRNILDEIKFIDTGSIVQKTIKFSYEETFNKSRQFLSKLEFLGRNETTNNNIYTFEYNDIHGLPSRFSYAQDHLGYYNGKGTNANFIPKVNDGLLLIPFNFADREAYFTSASKGILKKVTYPTKGFTEFQYESGKDMWPNEYEEQTKYLNVNYNTPANNGVIQMSSQLNPNSGGGLTILNPSRPVNVSVNATIMGPLSNSNKVKFTLDDLNSTNDFVQIIDLENIISNPNFPIKTINKNFTFSNLNPLGNYILKLEYYKTDPLANYPLGSNYLLVGCTVKYSNKIPLIKDKLGIRVQKIIDYSSTGQIADYKRYYYHTYAQRFNQIDSQGLKYWPNYVSDVIEESICMPGGIYQCVTLRDKFKVISSNSNNTLFSPQGAKYEFVTISFGGDNFENGGKALKFSVEPDTDLTALLTFSNTEYNHLMFQKYTNTGLNNGTLISEVDFMLRNGAYTPLTLKEYNYLYVPEKSGFVNNCFNNKMFLRNSCQRVRKEGNNIIMLPIDDYTELGPNTNPLVFNVRNFYFGTYKTYYKWYNLSEIITTKYFSTGNVVTSEKLFYDSKFAGLPSRKEYTGTDGTISQKFYYPKDLLSDPLMQELVNSNQYDIVRTESFKNSTKISENRTTYAKDATTVNKVRPKYEYSSKFPNTLPNISNIGQLEKNLTYNLYDSVGNMLQYTPEGGMSTSIIWGYNNQYAIAKIENATYSQVSSYASTLQTASNNGSLVQSSFSSLRNALPSSMVSTYTYKPLIGVSSMANITGIILNYTYDSFGRLQFVKDSEGNIVSENEYNYKP